MIYWTPRKLSRACSESPAGIKENHLVWNNYSCAVKPCVQNMLTIITRKCRTLWGEPEQAVYSYYGYMHTNRLSTEMMSRIASLHERHLCMTLAWSNLNPGRQCMSLYGLWAACCWWSFHSCCDKHEVQCRVCLNLSCLRYGFQCCTRSGST